MGYLPKSIKNLIAEFQKLPGVGPKTAERFVFYLLKKRDYDLSEFSEKIAKLKNDLVICSECLNIAESNPCEICSSTTRQMDTIAVVEKPLDMVALEKTGQYRGIYHILGGILSPIDGVTSEDLNIKKLIGRIKENKIKEIILALSPSLEGESTSSYLEKIIEKADKKLKITRIARGIPVGGDLEYADEITLIRALEGRRKY